MQKFNQTVSIKNVILKYLFETPRELKYTRCDIKNLKTFAIQVFYRDSTFLEVWIFWGFDLWVLVFEIPVFGVLFLSPCLRLCRQQDFWGNYDGFILIVHNKKTLGVNKKWIATVGTIVTKIVTILTIIDNRINRMLIYMNTSPWWNPPWRGKGVYLTKWFTSVRQQGEPIEAT